MNAQFLELLADSAAHQTAGRIYGVVIGVVTNLEDKAGLNRVAVSFPSLGEKVEGWARVAAPMAGKNRGFYFFPELQDEVLVMFERGDVRFPFVIGALWNGSDQTPLSKDEAKGNNLRVIKSRSGHVIKLNDKAGEETVEIVDKANNRIVIDTKSNTVTITAAKDIKLAAPDGAIELKAKTLTLTATGKATLGAGSDGMELAAKGGNLKLSGKEIDLN